ncbi:MAG: alpha/beta hydrolase [Phenylobacterium sp.]
MLRAIATVLAMAAAFSVCRGLARAEPPRIVSQTPPVQPGLSTFVLHSDRIGRDFQVVVRQPSATPFLPGQKFPVVYALDGGFGVAGAIGALLGGGGVMAPAYVVEVGYLPGQAAHRYDDLAHVVTKPQFGGPAFGGGGAAFEAFLLEDLRPFIAARFPVDNARSVLAGWSLGGNFAARVFADKPDAFSGWIMGSTAVSLDPDVVAAVARAAPRAKGARVYLAVGELEDIDQPGAPHWQMDGFRKLAEALKNRPGVALRTQVYAGETHPSYYPRLVTDGLPFVLPPRRPANFKEQILTGANVASYLGDYALPDGRTLTISFPNLPRGMPAQLTAQVAGIPPASVLQNGKDRFYVPTADLDVTFDKSGLTLTGADGGTLRAARAKTP